jgi:predicted dehydrogenase
MKDILRVGIIGAGRWARSAHLPGFKRSPLSEVVAVCDLDKKLAMETAGKFDIPDVYTDYREIVRRNDLDVIDVCTRAFPDDPDNHEKLVFAALENDKHCLCEKPVAHKFQRTWEAHKLAESKDLKTKVGLTFRYAPAIKYMYDLVQSGFIGDPFIFNGFEQNSQFIDPDEPVTKQDLIPSTKNSQIKVSSLEGYGAPIIDISLWMMNSDISRVVGILKNFVKYRTNLEGSKVRTNIDDGDIYIGEYQNGAICSIQSSYITVGNYPGIEARLYGSKGALICRLVEEESGKCQFLTKATPDDVEYRPLIIPDKYYPPGYIENEPWSSMFYSNLIHNFMEEIQSEQTYNQGNFAQSAKVQEIINAVEISNINHSWINLPL